MGIKIKQNIIENRLKTIFPNYIFDFMEYKNTHSKIGVMCENGHKSEQLVKNLSKGHGCNICGNKRASDKQRRKIDDVIEDFNKIHSNRYDYSKFNYHRNRIPSTIMCSEHGGFEQDATSHLKGSGCPKCSGNRRFTNDEFIEKSKSIHSIPYNYDLVEYENMHKKVKISCPLHGIFEQSPNSHTMGKGCPKCGQSVGEMMIEKFLQKNNINYISQKRFRDCRFINELLFDFFLPDYNTCIEFNGIQHYYPIAIFGGDTTLELNRKRDKIKYDYCFNNNINLIIIKQDKKHINKKDVIEQIESISNKLIKESYKMRYLKLFESLDNTLYVFDFDDTLVNTPRFEDLVIEYLRENSSIKDIIQSCVSDIGVSISDLKWENGRVFIDDIGNQIDIPNGINWIRKGSRIYLLSPENFGLTKISMPNSPISKMVELYNSVENKCIVTARSEKVRDDVKSILDKYNMEYPKYGVHMYPFKKHYQTGYWKGKTIIEICSKNNFNSAIFYDDNAKYIKGARRAVKELSPDLKFKAVKV